MTIKLIVGLPFIQATCATINLLGNVAELRALNALSFPLEFRYAMVHVPVMEGGDKQPVHLTNAAAGVIGSGRTMPLWGIIRYLPHKKLRRN